MLKSLSPLSVYLLLKVAKGRKEMYGRFYTRNNPAGGIATKDAQEKSEDAREWARYDILVSVLENSLIQKLGGNAPRKVCRKCGHKTWPNELGELHFSDCERRSELQDYISRKYRVGNQHILIIDYSECPEKLLFGYDVNDPNRIKKWYPKNIVDSGKKYL